MDGYDLDAPSIELAQRNAPAMRASADRVRVPAARRRGDPELAGSYELVFVFERIHDMSQPVEVLAACADSLARRRGRDRHGRAGRRDVHGARRRVERLMYGYSVLCCLPAGMAEQPSAARAPSCGRRHAAPLRGRGGVRRRRGAPDRARLLPLLPAAGLGGRQPDLPREVALEGDRPGAREQQTAAASGQRASGSDWRMKPPTAGPTTKPMSHEIVETAM